MASKYERVFPRLKRLENFGNDTSYQQKVEVVKQSILEAPWEFHGDELIHEMISEHLEAIQDEVKLLCQTLVCASRARQHASVFGRYWLELRRTEDAVENELKNVRLLLEAYHQLGVNQFEVESLDSLGFGDLGKVHLQPEIYAKVFDADKFRKFCIDDGLERSLNLHPSTMASLTKKRLIEGLAEPDGVEALVNKKFTK